MRNIHTHSSGEYRIERVQPLLGTFVKIAISDLEDASAHQAIDQGFAAIALIHRLMSFHEPDSDTSRLNREASIAPVTIHRHTADVIRLAQEISAASAGIFDITVASRLVEWRYLPAPPNAPAPDPEADWSDIEFVEPDRIRFRRPLWIDLGGIAKGYAVDTAIESMALPALVRCHVNAGGDLRIAGPAAEQVLLQVPGHSERELPMIEIAAGSIASSTSAMTRQLVHSDWVGPHVHGNERCAVDTERFASVVAERCAVADALTKVVLAAGREASAVLNQFDATAYLYDRDGSWQTLGRDS
ncbi:FAD:protein FMN transferase [Povalibacter sp.]|uniref:FAD:protein FMN transferase n=1 Tax=Povalibacter sp. TaxID=1962978 RepID=UPI002F3E263D